MKKRLTAVLLALALMLTIVTPALAADAAKSYFSGYADSQVLLRSDLEAVSAKLTGSDADTLVKSPAESESAAQSDATAPQIEEPTQEPEANTDPAQLQKSATAATGAADTSADAATAQQSATEPPTTTQEPTTTQPPTTTDGTTTGDTTTGDTTTGDTTTGDTTTGDTTTGDTTTGDTTTDDTTTDDTTEDTTGESGSGSEETTPETDPVVTQQEVAAFLLRFAGMKESQLGSYPDDYNAMAESMGLAKGFTYDPASPCTVSQFNTMLDNVTPLYDALHAEKKEPLFLNGMAQPIFAYDQVVRFCVYVETNYDTDGDGKLDLVKALVQLPGDVLDGMKVATIFEARPYITGCNSSMDPGDNYRTDGYDIQSMYAQPAPRTPTGESTTAQAVQTANKDDWYYYNPAEDAYVYEDLDWYDYYLVRGYAVVECGGLGTKGSDGFETCGADFEIDAFKCVIEWLTGDRTAYTDRDGSVAIKADWSTGNVGMTGRSYAGTTQFGLATTGVKGLKTVVPVAGIASWYEYTNSQGISTSRNPAYSDKLAWYCNGRYLDDADYATIADKYGNYLYQLQQDQMASNGDYSAHWANRDYTVDWGNIQCPALIVHGLNDDNVRTKEFDLMYDAFTKAGQTVKLLLHQGAHMTPTYPAHRTEMYIDGELYDSILNKWFSHYLYGVSNDIENMSPVTVQSNVDGKWQYYDTWKSSASINLSASSTATTPTTTISSDTTELEITSRNWRDLFTKSSTSASVMYNLDIQQDTTIKGAVAVHITASTDAVDRDALMMSAMLVDLDENNFMSYNTTNSQVNEKVLKEGGAWMGGGVTNYDLVEFTQNEAPYKIIARGWMDLYNPGAGYDSSSASSKVALTAGQSNDYTLYLQPNLYTVKSGHTLALVIYTYEPGKASYSDDQNYTITIDNTRTYASIPVAGEGSSTGTGGSGGTTGGGSSTGSGGTTGGGSSTGSGGTTGGGSSTGSGGATGGGSGGGTTTPAMSFTDVKAGDWCYDDVKYVYEKGLMNGVSATQFSPNATTTRAMIVVILWRLEHSPTADANHFTDIAADSWCKDATAWAAANNIVTGYADGTFRPNDTITREQFAAILYRYAQYKGYDTIKTTALSGFDDANAVSAYARDAVGWMVANGLMNGNHNQLMPSGNATRAQSAALLHRFLENVSK